MKFYLSAKFKYREELLKLAGLLQLNGHTVYGRWLTGTHNEDTQEAKAVCAKDDLEDIDNAETLVLFQLPTDQPELSTGRHVEYGYALARGKQLVIVGPITSVFHVVSGVSHFHSVNDFVAAYTNGYKWI